MCAYYQPPTENDPIFNSVYFQSPNNIALTKSDADATYLERVETATSLASSTYFAGDVSVGQSLLEYTAGTGLSVNGTANGESIFMNVLNAGGVTKKKVDLNPTYTHLYDEIRITESSFPTEYTSIQQVLTNLTVSNIYPNSLTLIRGELTSNAAIGLTSSGATITGNTTATGLNGLSVDNAIFGRYDTQANTFNGTLGYTRHPIGWTISLTKIVTPSGSNVPVDIIAVAPVTTAFTTLSNGVWEIGCCCNNLQVSGTVLSIKLSYGAATNMTCINGTIGSIAANTIHHQTTIAGLFATSYPKIIMRATGGGTITNINITFTALYSVVPTMNFLIYATKIA